jgi:hypothetical protein
MKTYKITPIHSIKINGDLSEKPVLFKVEKKHWLFGLTHKQIFITEWEAQKFIENQK